VKSLSESNATEKKVVNSRRKPLPQTAGDNQDVDDRPQHTSASTTQMVANRMKTKAVHN